MKLKTSFVSTPLNLLPALAITSWGLATGLLALTIYLVFSGLQLEESTIALVEEQEKLNSKWTADYEVNKKQLTRQRFEQLKSRLNAVNQLTEMGRQDISLILSQLERLMPDQFYLLSLNYRSVTDDLSLVIESPDTAKVADFIDKLETDKLFADISIVRQMQVSNKGRTAVQFEVQLKTRNQRGMV